MLKVRPLLVDNLSKELVLQPVPGHSKINKGGLGLNLRLIVRLGQFGMKDESKAWMKEALLVAHFDTAAIQVQKRVHMQGNEELYF